MRTKIVLPLVLFAILFGGASNQSPLFTSNQNTYFLHGLTASGYGYLSSDWLAQQSDITPVFSFFVFLINKYTNNIFFYLIFSILAGIYGISLLIVGSHDIKGESKNILWVSILVVLVLLHNVWMLNVVKPVSALTVVFSWIERLSSLSINGVAGQYLINEEKYLQPSTFGILLITSLALFLNQKNYLAVLIAVFAAYVHTSLILQAGILVFSYMVLFILENKSREAVKIGGFALILIFPILLYLTTNFLIPDSPVAHSVGQEISAILRQPHHALISNWFNLKTTGIQLGIVLVSLILSNKSKPIFIILFTCTLFSLSLTIIQIMTGNLTIALLHPWRTSVWLIPVSASIIISKCIFGLRSIIKRRLSLRHSQNFRGLIIFCSVFALLIMFYAGIDRSISNISQNRFKGEVEEYAAENASANQTYLIPIDKEDFRLNTGVPIFIDWKSHPFRSKEVIEWYERVGLANAFYQSKDAQQAALALKDIQASEKITHIIIDKHSLFLLDQVKAELVFQNDYELIFKISP
jgi:hypothetical protein